MLEPLNSKNHVGVEKRRKAPSFKQELSVLNMFRFYGIASTAWPLTWPEHLTSATASLYCVELKASILQLATGL